MATKSLLFDKIFLITVLMLVIIPELSAQEESPRLKQRFTWSGGENALRYEIIFERIEDSVNVFLLREFTAEHFIEVTLPPGNYRFRITPYDILNKPAQGTDWRYIEILRVPEPEEVHDAEVLADASGSSPEYVHEYELISGAGIESAQIIESKSKEPDYQDEPEELSEPEPEHISIFRYFEDLEKRIVTFGTPFTMIFPIYGNEFNDNLSFIGFGMRVSVVFLTPANIYIGPELSFFINSGKDNSIAVGGNFVAMKWMSNERAAIGLRFGAFYPVLINELNKIIVNAGVSFHWRFLNRVVLEFGLDYSHMFNNVSSGCFRPWIGLGYQF